MRLEAILTRSVMFYGISGSLHVFALSSFWFPPNLLFVSVGCSDYFAFELLTESKAMLYPPIRFFNSDISEWVSFPNTNKPCCLFPYPCLEAVNVIEVCSCLRSNEDEEESCNRHFEYLRERRRKPWRMETERDITPWWTSVTFRQTGENSGGKSC